MEENGAGPPLLGFGGQHEMLVCDLALGCDSTRQHAHASMTHAN